MARGRLRPKGWLIEGGSITVTYNSSSATWGEDVICTHTDISSDASAVEREKSGWYFKRILFEFRLTYNPTSVGNPFGVPVGVRLGTVADDVTLQKGASQQFNDFDFNEWTRVIRDQSYMAWEEAALVKDGSAVVVQEAGVVADGQTYPVPGQVHSWDLNVNLGLMEDHSLVVGIGPWVGGLGAPANGDEFGIEWKCKALLQKRKA